MERRGQKYHRERLEEALREEIETIVEGELGDPRIGLANVSSVELAEDSRSARILVVVEGDEAEADRTLEGLAAAIGARSNVESSQKYQARINELLNRAKKRSK